MANVRLPVGRKEPLDISYMLALKGTSGHFINVRLPVGSVCHDLVTTRTMDISHIHRHIFR